MRGRIGGVVNKRPFARLPRLLLRSFPLTVIGFFCLFLETTAVAVPRQVVVSAVGASIMDAATTDAQELGRADNGQRLVTSGRTSGDWLEIQAPAFVSGWVYGELVRDGVIAASSVKVRSGPGIGYASLGVLTRGETIAVRGRRGDWIEIEGQPALHAWIERSLVGEGPVVDLTASAAATPPVAVKRPETPAVAAAPVNPMAAARPAPAPPAAPAAARPVPARSVAAAKPVPARSVVAAAKPTFKPAVPSRASVPTASPSPSRPRRGTVSGRPSVAGGSPVGVRLQASAPQGQPAVVSGVLRPVGARLFSPAPYRLVVADDPGPARTLCYLTRSSPLPPMGTAVRLSGLKYWVVGSRQPVLLVRDINPFQ